MGTDRTSLFGGWSLRIDPWEVDYGDQTPLAASDDQPAENVDCEVECIASNWQVLTPARTELRRRIVLIDGVRSLEARGRTTTAACATVRLQATEAWE